MRRLTKWMMLAVLVLALAAGCARPAPEANPGTAAPAEGTDGAGDAAAASPTPRPTAAAETLAQELQGTDWELRLAAAGELVEREDLPVPERVDLLVTGLEQELAQPAAASAPAGAYLPASALTRLHLTRALAALGPEAVPRLREAAATASGVARAHLLIALTYAGDAEALLEVREFVTAAADPVVRMDAARALGQAVDADARPYLEAALQDPYVVTGTDHAGEFTLYPVREQAAAALRALGFTVARHENGALTLGE